MRPERDYEVEESEDSSEAGSHWSDDSSEIKCRCHDFVAHAQEALDEILVKLVLKVDNCSENIIVANLKRSFEYIDDIVMYINQFLHQAQVKVKHFIGFCSLEEEFRKSSMRTLTIVRKLRDRDLFQLVPLVQDLTLDLENMKLINSRTTLEQVKETLEDYRDRRSRRPRRIENFI